MICSSVNHFRFMVSSPPLLYRKTHSRSGPFYGGEVTERFFRTVKEQLLWVRHFQSVPELVGALEEFRSLYNQHWLIERLGFEPPVQARQRLALKPAA